MKEWTREERYRTILDASDEEMNELKEKVDSCPFRQKFHIQPPTGLLNDPNGFSYYNGEYHLFYQWFPLGPVHGVKHWYHVTSKDLVNWEDHGAGIIPTEYFESHGAFSGTGIVEDGKLYLFYTGNTRDENWVRNSNQCLALMDTDGYIIKTGSPVISGFPEMYTDNFRDPKVFKEGDKYYCMIGAERKAECDELKSESVGNEAQSIETKADTYGTIAVYESDNLLNWNYKDEIKTAFTGNGFMWECPDYLKFENQAALIFCPQGLEPQGDKYKNIFQSGYLIGDYIDFNDCEFNHGEFHELDRGFEFYAPQTTKCPDGRYVIVGWMGLPEIAYPTDENGWAHCLTIPREISLKGDRLIQKPVRELESLRGAEKSASYSLNNEEITCDGFTGTAYEVECSFKNFQGNKIGIKLRKGENEETVFYYDIEDKKLVLDRSRCGHVFAEEYGLERKCSFEAESIKLQIFVDVSSVEIFVNDGEEVFTARIFTGENSNGISLFADGCGEAELKMWTLK